MKIRAFVFPPLIMQTWKAIKAGNLIVPALEGLGITVEETQWDGKKESLPADELILVRNSTQLPHSDHELLSQNSIVFYDDYVVTQVGNQGKKIRGKEEINNFAIGFACGLKTTESPMEE